MSGGRLFWTYRPVPGNPIQRTQAFLADTDTLNPGSARAAFTYLNNMAFFASLLGREDVAAEIISTELRLVERHRTVHPGYAAFGLDPVLNQIRLDCRRGHTDAIERFKEFAVTCHRAIVTGRAQRIETDGCAPALNLDPAWLPPGDVANVQRLVAGIVADEIPGALRVGGDRSAARAYLQSLPPSLLGGEGVGELRVWAEQLRPAELDLSGVSPAGQVAWLLQVLQTAAQERRLNDVEAAADRLSNLGLETDEPAADCRAILWSARHDQYVAGCTRKRARWLNSLTPMMRDHAAECVTCSLTLTGSWHEAWEDNWRVGVDEATRLLNQSAHVGSAT